MAFYLARDCVGKGSLYACTSALGCVHVGKAANGSIALFLKAHLLFQS